MNRNDLDDIVMVAMKQDVLSRYRRLEANSRKLHRRDAELENAMIDLDVEIEGVIEIFRRLHGCTCPLDERSDGMTGSQRYDAVECSCGEEAPTYLPEVVK